VIYMKNILILICSLMILGCDISTDLVYSIRANNHSLYYSDDFKWCKSSEDICMYFRDKKLVYKSDTIDNWKNPKQTLADGGGDCEDFCILFLNILFVNTGIKGDIVLVNNLETNRNIVNGGNINHAVVIINSCIFDVVGERSYSKAESSNFNIGYIYIFNEIF